MPWRSCACVHVRCACVCSCSCRNNQSGHASFYNWSRHRILCQQCTSIPRTRCYAVPDNDAKELTELALLFAEPQGVPQLRMPNQLLTIRQFKCNQQKPLLVMNRARHATYGPLRSSPSPSLFKSKVYWCSRHKRPRHGPLKDRHSAARRSVASTPFESKILRGKLVQTQEARTAL